MEKNYNTENNLPCTIKIGNKRKHEEEHLMALGCKTNREITLMALDKVIMLQDSWGALGYFMLMILGSLD